MNRRTIVLLSTLFVATEAAMGQPSGGVIKPTARALMPAPKLEQKFRVEINGKSVGFVRKFDDLEAQLASAKTHQPGYSPVITLTRDWPNVLDWYDWRKTVLNGKTDRREVVAILQDPAGAETGRLLFHNCTAGPYTQATPNDPRFPGHVVDEIRLFCASHELK